MQLTSAYHGVRDEHQQSNKNYSNDAVKIFLSSISSSLKSVCMLEQVGNKGK